MEGPRQARKVFSPPLLMKANGDAARTFRATAGVLAGVNPYASSHQPQDADEKRRNREAR
jgi:hypothetical protein